MERRGLDGELLDLLCVFPESGASVSGICADPRPTGGECSERS